MKPKKIGFFGLFGQGNLGNDCTLQAIILNARKYLPGVEIYCICTGPEDIHQKFNIPTFSIKVVPDKVWQGKKNSLLKRIRKVFVRIPMELLTWGKAFKILKGTSMLVAPGSGWLTDYTTSTFGYPYFVFKWSVIAKLCQCKLLFVSVGAGPIYRPLTRWFIKSALSLADYRSYRDVYTKRYLESIGFNTNNDPVYPDLAFSLPIIRMPELNNRNQKRPVIGVGLINYYGQGSLGEGKREATYRSCIDKLSIFVTWLLEHKYTVRLLVGDFIYDTPVKLDLLELIKKRNLKYEESQFIYEPITTIEQLLVQIASADMVVSPRFHNILLAVMLNKPSISISYNEKSSSLMTEVGLGNYCQDIDYLDVDKLIEQFMDLENNVKDIKLRIQQNTEGYLDLLHKQYTIIFNKIF